MTELSAAGVTKPLLLHLLIKVEVSFKTLME